MMRSIDPEAEEVRRGHLHGRGRLGARVASFQRIAAHPSGEMTE